MSVYLIITCCIENNVGMKHYARRRQEYYIALSNVLNLLPSNIKPIIVENSKVDKSVLDIFKCDIVYTKDNSLMIEETDEKKYLLHKGYRELIDIKHIIKKYDIKDEDMIIKLTGRYMLFKDDFFTTIINNPDKDAIFREYNVCTYEKDDISIVMGMFALRCKYLKSFDYNNYDMGCEEEFRRYINNNVPSYNILKVDKLWLRCILGDDFKMVDC